ncbi:hypothetical protein K0M31_003652, partial [Melipona bicolor]
GEAPGDRAGFEADRGLATMRGLPGLIRFELLGACCCSTMSVWMKFLEDAVVSCTVSVRETGNVAYLFLHAFLSCPEAA